MLTAGQQIALQANANNNQNVFGSILFNVKAFGGIGNGIADDTTKIAAAITAAAITGGVVMFPPGTYITSNQTVPSNVTLWFANGAKLSINTGAVVTINGPIEADLFQIFAGLGTVAGTPLNNTIFAAWFGVPTVNTTDAAPTLRAAINFCQSANLSLTLMANSKIRVDTQIIIQHGTNSGAIVGKSFTMYGNNATIYPNFNGFALYVQPLCATANRGNGWAVASINLYDLVFDNYFGTLNSYAGSAAIKIGASGYAFDGYFNSVFQNILTSGFTTNSIVIESARKITFNRVFTRSTGINIINTTVGDFAGDSDFNQCEFGGNSTNRPLWIDAFSASGSPVPTIRGLRFNDCVFYGSGTRIDSSTNALVGDIWLSNCAWDVGTSTEIALIIYANGTAKISQVFIDSPYMVNYTGNAILAQTDSGTILEHFHVKDGHFGMITAGGSQGVIRLVSLKEAIIQGNTFVGCSGTNLIDVIGCSFTSIKDNIGQRNTSTYIVGIDNATVDFMVTGNIGKGGVNDLSGAVNKLVTNNLTTST